MEKEAAAPTTKRDAFSPGMDPCPAFKVCWKLGTSRPYCADTTTQPEVKKGKGSTEMAQLHKIEEQLVNMETCLHSLVLVMSDLVNKEGSK